MNKEELRKKLKQLFSPSLVDLYLSNFPEDYKFPQTAIGDFIVYINQLPPFKN